MSSKLNKCFKCSRRRRADRYIGATLMEVMAGLTLLATILVVLLQIEARQKAGRHQLIEMRPELFPDNL